MFEKWNPSRRATDTELNVFSRGPGWQAASCTSISPATSSYLRRSGGSTSVGLPISSRIHHSGWSLLSGLTGFAGSPTRTSRKANVYGCPSCACLSKREIRITGVHEAPMSAAPLKFLFASARRAGPSTRRDCRARPKCHWDFLSDRQLLDFCCTQKDRLGTIGCLPRRRRPTLSLVHAARGSEQVEMDRIHRCRLIFSRVLSTCLPPVWTLCAPDSCHGFTATWVPERIFPASVLVSSISPPVSPPLSFLSGCYITRNP